MNLRSAVVTIALAAMPTVLMAQASIYNAPANMGYYQWGLNSGAETIWGQTFTAPASPNTRLTDVTFYARDYTASPSLSYQFFVYAWGGSAPTGSALFTSALLSLGSLGGSYTAVPVSIGGLDLTGGSSYVWFAQAMSGSGSYFWDSGNPWDAYAGGELVLSADNGSTFLTGSDLGYTGYDFAFRANFDNVVPEPVTMLLLGTGLLGVAGAGLLRRRRAEG